MRINRQIFQKECCQIYQSYLSGLIILSVFYLIQLQIYLGLLMKSSRASALKHKYSKYDYKAQSASQTDRSSSQINSQNQTHLKKQSRVKRKKKDSQSSRITEDLLSFDGFRVPFQEIKQNGIKMTKKKPSNKAVDVNLRSTNGELKKCINQKQKELGELKISVKSIRETIANTQTKDIQEINNLRQTNLALHIKFDQQAIEMNSLKKQLQSLKQIIAEINKSQVTSLAISYANESTISRRAEYANNYEINAQMMIQSPSCERCAQYRQETEAVRSRYADELRKMQDQIDTLKKNEIIVEVLKQQIQNKNDCIDYLRHDLDQFERKSHDLLRIVYSLENRLEEKYEKYDYQSKAGRRTTTPKWSQMTPEVFNTSRY